MTPFLACERHPYSVKVILWGSGEGIPGQRWRETRRSRRREAVHKSLHDHLLSSCHRPWRLETSLAQPKEAMEAIAGAMAAQRPTRRWLAIAPYESPTCALAPTQSPSLRTPQTHWPTHVMSNRRCQRRISVCSSRRKTALPIVSHATVSLTTTEPGTPLL